ncbi:hypothetical protein ACF0H5_016253 [Mactra antiquata]
MYELLQPDVVEDFPTVDDVTSKIPHNIHQTAPSTCITQDAVKYVSSFVINNPHWNYYFWVDESARQLIERRHPYLLEIWDNVDKGIKRSDILRYVVLYEYGGVYADVDFENFKPLDRVTKKFHCIIPTEPLEHGVFLYRRPFVINNGIILCVKGHPFLKHLLENLKRSINDDVMSATGPLFITTQFIEYNYNLYKKAQEGTSEDFINLQRFSVHADKDSRAVHVPNTHYFTDNIDVLTSGGLFRYICKMFWFQSELQQRTCIDLAHKGLYRENTKFVYTKHHWLHSWCSSRVINIYRALFKRECVEITEIVPKDQLIQYM